MASYELIFVVEDVSETAELKLLADGINLSTNGRLQCAYVDATGESFIDALTAGYNRVRAHGVRILRLHLDLVTKTDIAERVGLTKPAISKWVRSSNGHDRFPVEHDWAATGPVWAWGEVNEWVRRNRKGKFDGFCSPNRREVEQANRWLETQTIEREIAPLRNWEKAPQPRVTRPNTVSGAWERPKVDA